MMSDQAAPRERMLTFRSGGWVILASFALSCLTAVYFLGLNPLQAGRKRGDGRNVASYGFDLSHCRARHEIAAAGFPKDGLEALNDPPMLTVAEAQEFHRQLQRREAKFIVPGERVIGVCVNGDARAYPVRLLAWHEIVNTTIGGRPVAITYDPLCDSTVVFDRHCDGKTLEFGVSGLVYNSNLLMYDRQSNCSDESLWAQLGFAAVSGPAAARGARLVLVGATVLPWSEWQRLHPDTKIMKLDVNRLDLYKQTYQHYYGYDALKFRVWRLPPDETRPKKTPLIAFRRRIPGTDAWRIRFQSDLGGAVQGADNPVFRTGGDPLTFWIEDSTCGDAEWIAIPSFWFAWYAQHEG